MQATPLLRTAATAGDHIDWMMTSPETIRLTLSSKVFQNARNWPWCFRSIRVLIVLSISALVMLPLSPYLMTPSDSLTIAASMMPIEGMFRIDALPLNAGSSEVLPLGDRPADEVRADAQRVGVVDRRHHREPLGRRLGELGALLAFHEAHGVRRGALRDDAVRRQLAGDEQRHDLVEVFELLGVHRLQHAAREHLLADPVFDVGDVVAVRLRHRRAARRRPNRSPSSAG